MMIDDMQELFSHASDAYRAGKVSGREALFDAALAAMTRISVAQESQQGRIAGRGFHVAQACCKALVHLKKKLDAPKAEVSP